MVLILDAPRLTTDICIPEVVPIAPESESLSTKIGDCAEAVFPVPLDAMVDGCTLETNLSADKDGTA